MNIRDIVQLAFYCLLGTCLLFWVISCLLELGPLPRLFKDKPLPPPSNDDRDWLKRFYREIDSESWDD